MKKLVGFRKYDFLGNDKQKIKCVKMYITDDTQKGDIFGICPDTVTVSEKKIIDLGLNHLFYTDEVSNLVGQEICVFYNKYGLVDFIEFPDLL